MKGRASYQKLVSRRSPRGEEEEEEEEEEDEEDETRDHQQAQEQLESLEQGKVAMKSADNLKDRRKTSATEKRQNCNATKEKTKAKAKAKAKAEAKARERGWALETRCPRKDGFKKYLPRKLGRFDEKRYDTNYQKVR